MMRLFRVAAMALLAILASTGPGSGAQALQAENKSTPVLRHAIPADHAFAFPDGFTANDLSHGNSAMRLVVDRRWSGSDTLNTRFGRGWSDQNDMELMLMNPTLLLILRGGVGWREAYKKSDKLFEGTEGERIERTDRG